MSTLTQFGGGSDIGSIVPGHFPGNPRYLPCDGVSTAPAVNSAIGSMYPRITQAVTVQADGSFGLACFRATSAAYGNNMWVAIGNDAGGSVALNYVMTSSDNGTTWVRRPLPHTASWTHIHWNGSMFVMAGRDTPNNIARILFSTDGMRWDAAVGTGNHTPNGIACIGSKWLISTTTNGIVFSSVDGITFVATNSGSGVIFNDIIAFKNVFYASTSSGQVFWSTDGNTWSISYTGASSPIGLVTNGSILVMLSQGVNGTATTTDGITWTPRTVPALRSAAWNGTFFLATNGSSTGLQYSTDGITWSSRTGIHAFSSTGARLAANPETGDVFLFDQNLAGFSSFITTTDGTNYSIKPFERPGRSNNALVYAHGMWIQAGVSRDASSNLYPYIASSTDGVEWITRPVANAYGSTNPGITAMASSGTITVAVVSGTGTSYTTSDGINWVQRSLPGAVTASNLIWNGSMFLLMSNTLSTYYTSTDGISWTSRTFPVTMGFVAWNGTIWCACQTTGGTYTSSDGISWTAAGAIPNTVAGLFNHGARFIATGSGLSLVYTSTTAASWSSSSLGQTIASTARVFSTGSLAIAYTPSGGGSTGFYSTSTDGTTWVARAFDHYAQAGPFGPAVAVNPNNSQIMFSSYATQTYPWNLLTTDGITWTYRAQYHGQVTTPTSVANTVAGDKVLGFTTSTMAISQAPGAALYTLSTNTWQPIIIPTRGSGTPMQQASHNGSLWVAAGAYGSNITIATSPDGIDWTLRDAPTLSPGQAMNWSVLCVQWTGSTWVIFTTSSYILTSSDGITWTRVFVPFIANSRFSITFGDGKFMVIPGKTTSPNSNERSPYYLSSDNGSTWTAYVTPLAYAKFCTHGSSGFMLITQVNNTEYAMSTDGINWTVNSIQGMGIGQSPANLSQLGWTGGMYYYISSNQLYATVDGKTWVHRATSLNAVGTHQCSTTGGNTTLFSVSSYSPGGVAAVFTQVDISTVRAPSLSSSAATAAPFYNYSLVIG